MQKNDVCSGFYHIHMKAGHMSIENPEVKYFFLSTADVIISFAFEQLEF